MPYNHHEIEKKWQDRWESSGVFHAKTHSDKPKFYCLVEFPFPSGAGLHIGHPRSYTALDVIARKRRMEGMNVLYPMGWDAFGLPAENYAIKMGRNPKEITKENIATFKRQLQSLGFSFDWSREINTTDPEYYKWTQWMFIEFFKAGLAYKTNMPINWCLSCQIGLANEEVVDGKCERCGGPTEKRDKKQWMIAITNYADRLVDDLDDVNYLEKIKIQQRNWIGRSVGAEIPFVLRVEGQEEGKHSVRVFTTRPDTLFGATFLVIAPELAMSWMEVGWQATEEVRHYVTRAMATAEEDRTNEKREKTGVDTGVKAVNPATGEEIPVWVADYVLGNYGTGAIMAVPAHDERDYAFAQTFGLPIKSVIQSTESTTEELYDGPGALINSGEFTGMESEQAKWAITEKVGGQRKTQYRLRDWVFSRQRYWGEPIPLIECATCGWVPVPNEQLPVTLPEVEKYEPTENGESPLAVMTDWVNTTCPTCQGPAKRETDTMPNWAGSSWYFLAYAMHDALKEQPTDVLPDTIKDALAYWMPVDWYNGGMEHTTLHLLYSRFWNKFLYDRGHVPTSEPYARRTSHGLILAADGSKMSKSKGNVVNPDEMVDQYGADAVRLYEVFMGPFGEPVPWSINGLVGMRRFLEKVVDLSEMVGDGQDSSDIIRLLHKTMKKVTNDIEAMRFNTAVSQLMVFVNAVKEQGSIHTETFEIFLRLLCPFAPHLANELFEQLGGTELLETRAWPVSDPELARDEVIELAVQVNGKLRATVQIEPDATEERALALALQDQNIQKYLSGGAPRKVIYVAGRILNLIV